MIDAGRFVEFFRDIHGFDPFPWQTRLLNEVLSRQWPRSIALPTASGKTAVMDIAVFALACQAHLRPGERTAPRRIALVVDRRIVVDDAYRRACKIRDALAVPKTEILREVASALSGLGGEIPLDAALLRGGIYREDRWARTPAQPVILCSTVDQVGSRLLFRGYGLSSGTWPIHAGLLGNDTLIVLDEAHCSVPFLQTLEWIAKYRQKAEQALPVPFALTAMTATPHDDETPFELNEADHKNVVMRKRLKASKLVSLLESPKGEKGNDGLVTACINILKGDAKQTGFAEAGTSVLVVLNRVASARALRERLRDETWPHEAILLTGRSRSAERDELLERYRDHIMAGRKRGDSKGKPPLIIVATQCVEVGADLDADALITEACPLDAFRQRLGRLDRLGEIGETRAKCLLRAEYAGENRKADPIYGDALVNTWLWLKENADSNGVIDCGIDALSRRLPAEAAKREALCAPAADAPVILPAHCDLWCQTGPEPAVSPDPEIFLHGPQSGPADVRFIWRADLDPGKPETWTDTVSFCPPVSGETLPIPIGQARAWLAQEMLPDCADIEGSPDVDEGRKGKAATNQPPARKALRWFGPERSEVIVSPGGLRPGDIVILPASDGGCDSEGWNPASSQTADIAMLARMKARRAAVLRLHPALLDEWGEVRSRVEPFAMLDASKELPDDIEADVGQMLSDLRSRQDLPDVLARAVAVLQEDTNRYVEPHPSGRGLVVYTRKRLGEIDFTDEDSQSFLARNDVVFLEDHLKDVESRARECSGSLPDGIRRDIAIAARFHDIGKADPRFQTLLAGGNRLRALRNGLLAKSSDLRAGFSAYNAAREKAGYPKGGRHELLSVRLAESRKELLQEAGDADLVLHLIACHHGNARPFAPAVDDPSPIDVILDYEGKELRSTSDTGLEHLDSGVPERFWRLVRRYGWWGLAYIEACLRLADHRASESPTPAKRKEGAANEQNV